MYNFFSFSKGMSNTLNKIFDSWTSLFYSWSLRESFQNFAIKFDVCWRISLNRNPLLRLRKIKEVPISLLNGFLHILKSLTLVCFVNVLDYINTFSNIIRTEQSMDEPNLCIWYKFIPLFKSNCFPHILFKVIASSFMKNLVSDCIFL